MSVYVDDIRAQFGRMVMCHMVADTTAELLAMADRIGVARRWLQDPGEPTERFDIALSKRALAVKAGAIEANPRHIVRLVRKRRERALWQEAIDNGLSRHEFEPRDPSA